MHTIQLGSESEFVRITLRNPYLSEGWCQASVEIVVPGFSGQIEPWLEAGDIESFHAELEQLYKSLKGVARLHPREEQFTLLVQAKAAGHVTVSGVAWSQATFGNKLAFAIELDQSYLPSTLSQMTGATSAK
ncbi:hypothetical protein LXT12_26580 [Pelomonas sp. P7]|uniref:Uncharacterized protein n=1 Tax=Pelomonas caseinilytica TaxID=2906763 RepID=A0ABS8XPP1_9BURK|nr:hypothetical protein [Pelomonas sp. P7]MCE4540796.1 hypothetical protein [Pelomonas sp. P7]